MNDHDYTRLAERAERLSLAAPDEEVAAHWRRLAAEFRNLARLWGEAGKACGGGGLA